MSLKGQSIDERSFGEFSFVLQNGMIVESMVAEGGSSRRLRGVVVSVTDTEIVVWPVDTPMQQTQMTVLPRLTAQYYILRSASPSEIVQAIAGVRSVVKNWQITNQGNEERQASQEAEKKAVNEKPIWT